MPRCGIKLKGEGEAASLSPGDGESGLEQLSRKKEKEKKRVKEKKENISPLRLPRFVDYISLRTGWAGSSGCRELLAKRKHKGEQGLRLGIARGIAT